MANIECPFCHSATDSAGKLRYCPQCGWNKKEAAQQLRLSLKLLPLWVLATIIFAVLFLRSLPTKSQSLYGVALAIPLAAFAFAYLWAKRNLSKLESVPGSPKDRGATVGVSAHRAAEEPTVKDRALFGVARPRGVRMTRRGKRSIGMIAALVCAFEGLLISKLAQFWSANYSSSAYQRKDWALMGLALLLLLLPLSVWRSIRRERGLLETGELTMGRILKKWNTRDGVTVFYEFQDQSGQTQKRSGMDYSRTLEIGMAVPVFYDRENPKRQVPACGALHEVVI
jgi:hypothetical protein